MKNTNLLKGFKCPACGYKDEIRIACRVTADMFITDNAYDVEEIFSVDWDDISRAECTRCNKEGRVRDFTTESAQ